MDHTVIIRGRLVAGVLAVVAFSPSVASAYSTKLHMITAHHIAQMLKQNGCKLTLGGWNKPGGQLDLAVDMNGNKDVGKSSYTVDLSGEICQLITNPKTYPYFLSATTGPDTFPGMFGNTDPTHALLWNTAWQIPVLWQNAKSAEEKAFVLGWVVHFAGDLNAHGLANMHANGVWMAGGEAGTVWKHIVSETYYASKMLSYPKGFDNRLVWPKAFVKKMFFSPVSPLYKHFDYNWNRYVRTEEIGLVSKIFGGVYRAHFLLWDMHAREMNRWEGRKEYFKPRKNNSLNDWFHWIFADQAWNFHKKKEAAARNAIDVWYEATHRAQQAIVADPLGLFKGDKGYDKIEPGRAPKKNYYKGGGVGGMADAYKYWATQGIWPLLDPSLITITKENFPVLYQAIEAIKKLGTVLSFIADGLKQVFDAFIDVLTAPLKLIRDAIMAALQPMIDEYKEYLKEEAYCNPKSPIGMKPMCDSINAQRAAFKVSPGNMQTYLNWPIYRNTVTAGGLMLERMKTLSKTQGDESMSPIFGLPSGDFGCTLECTGAYKEHANLFMPVAGKYYDNPSIKTSFPDYCVAGKEKRRNLALNEGFAGKTNSQANILDTVPKAGKEQAPGFTCFAAGTGKTPNNCPADAYNEAAQGLTPGITGGPKWVEPFVKLMGDFYARIGGRWDYHVHDIPTTVGRFVIPPDGANMKEEFTWLEAPGTTPPPILGQKPPEQPPAEQVKYVIEIVSATYGGNCPVPRRTDVRRWRIDTRRPELLPNGNQTRALAAECNGKTSCAYVVDMRKIGDLSPGCAKSYVAEYRCARDGDLKTASIPGEAGHRKTLVVSCVAPSEDTSYRGFVPTIATITRLPPVVFTPGLITPAPVPKTGRQAPYCYQALAYGGGTIAPESVNPVADHANLNKKEPYSIEYYVSNAFNSISKFLSGTLNAAWQALKEKACKWVDEKVQAAYNFVIGTPAGKVCAEAYCKVASMEIPMSRKCIKRPCFPKVWETCTSCGDVPGTPRLNESKYRKCVEDKCKQWTTRKVKVCQ